MSAPYLPSKTLHSKDPEPQKCPSNNILKNIHAVSVCDLLTVDTIVGVGVGVLAGSAICRLTGLTGVAGIMVCAVVMTIVLVLWVMVHVWWGMPSNLAYYFGFGKPPHVFKTCACFPTPSAETWVNDGSGYAQPTPIGRVYGPLGGPLATTTLIASPDM